MNFDVDQEDIADRRLLVTFNEKVSDNTIEQIRNLPHVDDVARTDAEAMKSVNVLIDEGVNVMPSRDLIFETCDDASVILPALRHIKLF